MSNSEMALPGQLEKQFVLRFLGLGYTMILELVNNYSPKDPIRGEEARAFI